MSVLMIVIALLCASWVVFYASAVWSVFHIDVFEAQPVPDETDWPRLSVIAPACNEADTIRPATESLAAQDYPDYEVVVVDDRSTDGTGEIVDDLAGSDERIIAVHVAELPAGWLGKVNAMRVGLEHATGDLLLFTDADVNFAPDALRRAVGVLRERRLDHLTIIPSVRSESVVLESVLSAFGTLMLATSRAHRMKDPDSDAVIGVGAFNLFRRDAYAKTPGLEWLRMDVVDDTAFAKMLQLHGARQEALISQTDVDLDWYPSVGALVRGLEKNLFAVGCGYSIPRALLNAGLLIVWAAAPFAALVLPGGLPGALLFGVAVGSMLVSNLILSRRMARGTVSILLLPLAQLIVAISMLRSMWVTVRNDGVTWRGTHYPLDELRDMQRFTVS